MEPFLDTFCLKYNLKHTDVQCLVELMETKIFSNGETILDLNANDMFYIITEGIWRGYRMLDGEEQTLWLMCKDDVVLIPSIGYTVESISESKAFCIAKSILDNICKKSHTISNILRTLFEFQYLNTMNWLTYLCLPTAEERYLTLLQNEPQVLQNVPLKYIASFLGITPQSLSRIRRKIGEK